MPNDLNSIIPNSIKDGWLTTGSQVYNFEKQLEKYLNAKHVVAVNSCTAALHLSLLAKGFFLKVINLLFLLLLLYQQLSAVNILVWNQ